MLIRFAKLAGGLRLLIATTAPLVVSSSALFSARTAAYLVGFGLGSIGAGWLAIVATLVAVTGFWGAGANTAECEAYNSQRRAIDTANKTAMANYQTIYTAYFTAARPCFDSISIYYDAAYKAAAPDYKACMDLVALFPCCKDCKYCGNWWTPCVNKIQDKIDAGAPKCPASPPQPILQTYPACASPNCPPGKKVWTQVLWGSPTGNFVDSKGCFIVAYSQDAPDIPVNIEYNPFLPKLFVQSRAISYYLVDGDRFRSLNDKDWKNLESVQGWDKGYWKAEQTDSECRGWRPGWSRKVK